MPVYNARGHAPPPKEVPAFPKPLESPLYADTLSILYVILVHSHPDFACRMINALHEQQHTFVVHVDLKYDEIYYRMKKLTRNLTNVYIMDDRINVIWGGFTVVNATLAGMNYAWKSKRHFDYMIDISGTTYPIKSNKEIKETLSQKQNAIYMDVHDEPNRPTGDMWHQFIECDGILHRIGRLPIIRGMNMHVGSQWFALPRHAVIWILESELARDYVHYAKYVVVADEHYFATLIKNSPYCADIIPKNLLFLLFDKWENEKNMEPIKRDSRKCLHPDPNHCGRSPTTLTPAFTGLLEISRALFARKFDPLDNDSMALVDEIDSWRSASLSEKRDSSWQWNAIMIRQSIQGNSYEDLCWEMPIDRNILRMAPCNPSIESQWFVVGPCTGQSYPTFKDGKCSLGQKKEEQIFCQIQSFYSDHCADISGENPYPGGHLIGWDCTGAWNQLFRFKSDCSISSVQPDIISRVRGFGLVNVTLCLEPQIDPMTGTLAMTTAECKTEKVGKTLKAINTQAYEIVTKDGPTQGIYEKIRKEQEGQQKFSSQSSPPALPHKKKM